MSPRPTRPRAKKTAKNKSTKQSILHVAILQMNSTPIVQENVENLKKALREIQSQPCDLVCLPENALSMRVSPSEKLPAITLKEEYWAEIGQLLPKGAVLLVGSIPFQKARGQRLSNATVLLRAQEPPRVVYEKIHLFDVDVHGAPAQRESKDFTAGQRPAQIEVKGWRVGLSICYDLRFSYLYDFYARRSVDLLLVPAAFLRPTGEAHWELLLRARAIESQSYVVAAAQSGGHRNAGGKFRNTHGHSLVVAPWGEVKLDLGRTDGAYQWGWAQLKAEEIERVREQIPMRDHRRSGIRQLK